MDMYLSGKFYAKKINSVKILKNAKTAHFLVIICKVAFWQDNCSSKRSFYKFSHNAGKIALFLQNVWVK